MKVADYKVTHNNKAWEKWSALRLVESSGRLSKLFKSGRLSDENSRLIVKVVCLKGLISDVPQTAYTALQTNYYCRAM